MIAGLCGGRSIGGVFAAREAKRRAVEAQRMAYEDRRRLLQESSLLTAETVTRMCEDPARFGFVYDACAMVWRRYRGLQYDELDAPPPKPKPFWEEPEAVLGPVTEEWCAAGFHRVEAWARVRLNPSDR